MPHLRIATTHLVGLLTDLNRTASADTDLPALNAVLLHSDRGDWSPDTTTGGDGADGDAPPLIDEVTSDLLIGTSTDRYVIGQAHAPAEGQLPHPVLLPLAECKTLIAVFKPIAAAAPKTSVHRVWVTAETGTLRIAEDPDGTAEPVTLNLPTSSVVEDFPRGTDRLMDPDPYEAVAKDDQLIDPSRGTGFSGSLLGVVADVAKRRRMPVAMYRHHQHRGVVVEVGASWRGVLMPAKLDDETTQHTPQVPVFAPPLPARGPDPVTTPTLVDVVRAGARIGAPA